jgi:integrase
MSIRKRKDDRKLPWLVDYRDGSGKRRFKSFATKAEAVDWETSMRGEVRAGTHTADSASITVREAGELWLSECDASGLEWSTLDQYRTHVDRHIVPFIGAEKLSRLTAASVKGFVDTLRDEGRSSAMQRKVHVSLSSILRHAQECGLVNQNVAALAKRRRESAREKRKLLVGRDIPTKDEIRAILDAATGRNRALLIAAAFTGLRASELRGLEWNSVNFNSNCVTVSQRADKRGVMGNPKSGSSHRGVGLIPMAANALREWSLAGPNGDLVFPSRRGGVESHTELYRAFGRAQKAAGVVLEDGTAKYTKFHALRHFFASLLISNGYDALYIKEAMGHSSIKVTYDVYGHLFPDENQSEKLAAMQASVFG